ncbi:aspartate aminotransferase family protein [Duganella sp. BJB488]|uniref:aspartate aminotransferase family protein n=1 Tax=unclassified Duganella TaxID=2636909 RepID=UPI000E352782|nr:MULTISPECIES: aspartate aminotransferase family protein [unclassified Duganella]RFP16668.1 aspartate aminotransferase family protein [Duganella sp. BJB489]RFP20906.1 aspartate aminotransferase family protein [Duganella sp. BJB488]RFP32030.1 aspartate aminotransferase family protein [Duganella sp. BJB480]
MSHIIHRNLRRTPPLAVSASGLTVRDSQGRSYLDASGGAAVSSLGHAHPDVLAAMHAQIDRNAYAHTAFFTCDAAEELATRLANDAPGDLDHVYLVSGGSEAMETALKLARQYWLEAGQPDRSVFIGLRQSYHGNTLGALAIGGNEWRRRPFEPLLMEVPRVSPCNEYRGRADGQSTEDYTAALLAELETTILEQGPQHIIGFVAETVVGATGGAVPPTPGYFKGVRKLCDQYGILLILDEVMCGMGRTGTLYAFEQDGVVPDLVVLGKGLGAGYQPIGAVLAREHIVRQLRDGSGAFLHGHTYMGHPVAAAAALAVQKVIQRDCLLGAVTVRGAAFRRMLRDAFGGHPHVGDIRGRGMLLALELVRDRDSKQPFDPACQLHAAVKEQAMSRGLMVYPMGGTIDGRNGDHILLAPPFIATEAELAEITSRLADALTSALTSAT